MVLLPTWMILAIPLLSFIINGLFVRRFSGHLAAKIGTIAIGFNFLFSLALAYYFFQSGELSTLEWHTEWLRFQSNLIIHIGVMIDPLSAMMLVVVNTISFFVHIYSLGYMHDDEGVGRFFSYLSLFTFSMLGLVVAPNLFQMYVFWELVGVSSFLLIGFYYTKPSAVSAAKKAFIVTRFADLGFLIGILLLGYLGLSVNQGQISSVYSPLDFLFLNNPDVGLQLASSGLLTTGLLLIFIGAAGKSALFPLHIWLPDAMEGPTPVSALIHAATMVVAGVYLVARLFPLFNLAPVALEVVSWVGLFTSLFAAVIACTQDDIKRVLAFSTLSQIGYMIFALGVASDLYPLGYTASLFHLFTHAFFKALLFLGAGSIIHAVHTNDVWQMGGLKKYMPITHITFLVAVLSISGIFPFSGFFSKDEILTAALESGHMTHYLVGLFVALLTSFYMGRIYFLTFWGQSRSHENASHHPHESTWVMTLPLVLLAILALSSGWLPFANYLWFAHKHDHHSLNMTVAFSGTLAAIIGLSSAWFLYSKNNFSKVQKIQTGMGQAYQIIKAKFYFDELYIFVTHKIVFNKIAGPIAWFDKKVVDGGVDLTGEMSQTFGQKLTLIQTGQVQNYIIWFIVGFITVLTLYYNTVL